MTSLPVSENYILRIWINESISLEFVLRPSFYPNIN